MSETAAANGAADANKACLPVPASAVYRQENSGNAPVLLYHLYGALDAGSAAQLAIQQILATLPSERIATFNADDLLDYRARRPLTRLENWVIDELEMPELALDLVTDLAGKKLLVLHGPEPDYRWHAFGQAVVKLARECGVQASFDMMGMPAALPHTRTSLVHETAIDASVLPEQAQQPGPIRFSASAGIYLQRVLGEAGITAKGLLVGVPYYLAEDDYPTGAVALLQHLARTTQLELPIGDLEELAAVLRTQLDAHVQDNSELAALLEQLETNFDNAQIIMQKQVTPGLTPEATDMGSDLADRFEEFLRQADELAGRESDAVELNGDSELMPENAELAAQAEEAITRPLFIPRRRMRARWQRRAHRDGDTAQPDEPAQPDESGQPDEVAQPGANASTASTTEAESASLDPTSPDAVSPDSMSSDEEDYGQ